MTSNIKRVDLNLSDILGKNLFSKHLGIVYLVQLFEFSLGVVRKLRHAFRGEGGIRICDFPNTKFFSLENL